MQKKQATQLIRWRRNLIQQTRQLRKQDRLLEMQDVRNELLLKALES